MIEWRIAKLSQAIQEYPHDPYSRLLLANCYRQRYELARIQDENLVSILELSETVEASEFPNVSAVKRWLGDAFGESIDDLERSRHQAESAIRISPMLGKAYVLLADLSFLPQQPANGRSEIYQQAAKVRPYDGIVLYEVGKYFLSQNELDFGFDYWKQAASLDRFAQKQILSHAVMMSFSRDILLEFVPDLEAASHLKQLYANLPQDSEATRGYLIHANFATEEARTTSGKRSSMIWLQAADSFDRIGQPKNVLTCVSNACMSDPNNYPARRQLALHLVKNGQHELAQDHLVWCSRRTPDDPLVQKLMDQISHIDD